MERTHYVKTGLVGEKVGKVSLLRDVAQDLSKRHRGHIDILNELAEKAKSIKSFRELYNAWTEVFNISTLNKKFYAELSNWYFWALKHVEFPKGFENGQKWENDASDIDKKECNAQALIRFITRIIFIWFLKEKGLVNKNLFDRDKIKNILNEGLLADEQSAYYRAVLQNLFFCVLNTERNADSPKPLRFFTDSKNTQHMVHTRMRYRKLIQNENELINWWEDTPFLNGGLFECLDYEIKESNSTRRRFDSFSDNPINENQLPFPNLLFWSPETKTDLSAFFGEDSQKSKKANKHADVSVRGIFNILNRYKFTIEENTPLEQEIALDPELLGRIFENLLASYNPETEETARKSTGSFYTPREIVEYMVDESLIAYLQQNVPAISDENTFRLLLTDSEEKPNLSPKQCLQIIDAVEKLKIIDPACGSGAFPMGILHKLVVILRKADPQNLNWKQAQINALETIRHRKSLRCPA